MIFFVGSLNTKYDKEELVNAYNEYYAQHMDMNCYEAKNFNFIAFDNCKNNVICCERDDIGIYGDLTNIFLRKKSNVTNICEEIIELYKVKGKEFVKELSGDFSFVLVDFINRKLFMVRDHFGIQQLFWYKKGEKLVFSNFLYALKKYYDPATISRKYLEEYCNNNGMLDFKITPYKNIYRVNVATIVEMGFMGNTNETQYWNLSNIDDNGKEKNEKQWVEEIDKLLKDAVCKRNKGKTAILMGGGLDSTTLFTYYAKTEGMSAECFSAVFKELKSCDESMFIDEVIKFYPDEKYNKVNCDNTGLCEGYPESYFYTSEPHVNTINKALIEKLFDYVKNKEHTCVVDAFFADYIFNGSIYYLIDLIKKGKFAKSYSALMEYAMMCNKSIWKVIEQELLPVKKNKLFGFSDSVIEANRSTIKKAKKYSNIEMIVQIRSSITRNFSDFELAPRYHLQCLHPFVDVDLVEALYKIPGELKCFKGTGKNILKKVVANRLPALVTDRVVKTLHVELAQKGLRDNWANIYNMLGKGRICEFSFIDMDLKEWKRHLLDFRNGKTINEKMFVFMSIEIWLHQLEEKYGKIKFEE